MLLFILALGDWAPEGVRERVGERAGATERVPPEPRTSPVRSNSSSKCPEVGFTTTPPARLATRATG
jgi:hypothetical protein